MKHYWGRVKAALGFGQGRIRTLGSIATYSSYLYGCIMGKGCCDFFSAVFHPTIFILAGNNDNHESKKEFKLWRVPTTDFGVGCPLESESSKFCQI